VVSDVGGTRLFTKGHGFGMGMAVVMEPADAMSVLVGGGLGSVGWPGGFGGWWRADPTDGSVMIFLTHNLVERDQFDQGVGMEVYSAIGTFQNLVATG
jgi:CubicO group peptidase (beta-lactamase class C family)